MDSCSLTFTSVTFLHPLCESACAQYGKPQQVSPNCAHSVRCHPFHKGFTILNQLRMSPTPLRSPVGPVLNRGNSSPGVLTVSHPRLSLASLGRRSLFVATGAPDCGRFAPCPLGAHQLAPVATTELLIRPDKIGTPFRTRLHYLESAPKESNASIGFHSPIILVLDRGNCWENGRCPYL